MQRKRAALDPSDFCRCTFKMHVRVFDWYNGWLKQEYSKIMVQKKARYSDLHVLTAEINTQDGHQWIEQS